MVVPSMPFYFKHKEFMLSVAGYIYIIIFQLYYMILSLNFKGSLR